MKDPRARGKVDVISYSKLLLNYDAIMKVELVFPLEGAS